MGKSAITFTRGSEWWLERVTTSGRNRYPRRILVGELGRERVYVPELTCRYVGDEISGGCSECRGWLDPACSYCPSCGARIIKEDA